MRTRTALRICFFSIFAVICLYQCNIIITTYIGNPRIIDINDMAPELASSLPAITICSNNRLSVSKFMARNGAVREGLKRRMPAWFERREPLLDPDEFIKLRDAIAATYKELNIDVSKELKRNLSDLDEVMPDMDKFIAKIQCANIFNGTDECEGLIRIESFQDRKCLTLLHKAAMLRKLHELFADSPANMSIMEPKNSSFLERKQVLKVLIDFKPEDYGDMKRQIGARIVIHSNNYVASANDADFFITRGFKYTFNIFREEMINSDNCYDYDLANADLFKTKSPADSINPRVPLSGETCAQNCIIRNVVHWSKCWPTTVAYFKNDSLDPERTARGCKWFRNGEHYIFNREQIRIERMGVANSSSSARNLKESSLLRPEIHGDLFREDLLKYTNIKRFCLSKCRVPCKMSQYSVTMTKTVWPTDMQIYVDSSGNDRLLRHCCAIVSIKYSHFYYGVHEFINKYNLSDTVGNLLGLLAVWMGISIISVYNAIQYAVDLCHNKRARTKVGACDSTTASVSTLDRRVSATSSSISWLSGSSMLAGAHRR